jgi:hypothetical protein
VASLTRRGGTLLLLLCAQSRHFLAFLTAGYTESLNCMRELLRAVLTKKPITLMLDPDLAKGGVTWQQVEAGLATALSSLEKWGLAAELRAWHKKGETLTETPTLQMLIDGLRNDQTLLYSRLRVFIIPTLRTLAQTQFKKPQRLRRHETGNCSGRSDKARGKLLDRATSLMAKIGRKSLGTRLMPKEVTCVEASPEKTQGSAGSTAVTYIASELARKEITLPPPRGGRHFHVFVSEHNAGADELMTEVERSCDLEISRTSEPQRMFECEFFCVLLDKRTWTNGARSERFGLQLERALERRMHVLLCHEEPGYESEARHAVEFNTFFLCDKGETPRRLVNMGIYHKIALPMQGGMLRPTSLAIVAGVLSALRQSSVLDRIKMTRRVDPLARVRRVRTVPTGAGDALLAGAADDASASSARKNSLTHDKSFARENQSFARGNKSFVREMSLAASKSIVRGKSSCAARAAARPSAQQARNDESADASKSASHVRPRCWSRLANATDGSGSPPAPSSPKKRLSHLARGTWGVAAQAQPRMRFSGVVRTAQHVEMARTKLAELITDHAMLGSLGLGELRPPQRHFSQRMSSAADDFEAPTPLPRANAFPRAAASSAIGRGAQQQSGPKDELAAATCIQLSMKARLKSARRRGEQCSAGI